MKCVVCNEEITKEEQEDKLGGPYQYGKLNIPVHSDCFDEFENADEFEKWVDNLSKEIINKN